MLSPRFVPKGREGNYRISVNIAEEELERIASQTNNGTVDATTYIFT